MSAFSEIVDQLTYVNYAINRDANPEITAERWAKVYPNAQAMEARYQAEKAITKAQSPEDPLEWARRNGIEEF